MERGDPFVVAVEFLPPSTQFCLTGELPLAVRQLMAAGMF
jgi:hypothetical protein